jgi:xanthine dehydrogenase YagR molybdenum-binding subunit
MIQTADESLHVIWQIIWEIEFLDKPDLLISPVGARGIGEIGITGMAAAIANAITNATGKRVRDLPVTLDKLMT